MYLRLMVFSCKQIRYVASSLSLLPPLYCSSLLEMHLSLEKRFGAQLLSAILNTLLPLYWLVAMCIKLIGTAPSLTLASTLISYSDLLKHI